MTTNTLEKLIEIAGITLNQNTPPLSWHSGFSTFTIRLRYYLRCQNKGRAKMTFLTEGKAE